MIFDTIYNFYLSILQSTSNVSPFWQSWAYDLGNGPIFAYDFFSAIATVVTIGFGVFALFRILGGILKLFKV